MLVGAILHCRAELVQVYVQCLLVLHVSSHGVSEEYTFRLYDMLRTGLQTRVADGSTRCWHLQEDNVGTHSIVSCSE